MPSPANLALRAACAVAVWLAVRPSGLRAEDRAADRAVDFLRDVRPILTQKCFACHGPDAKQRKGGLRLDTRAGATADLGGGTRAIVPGDPPASELVRRVSTSDLDDRMPPRESGKTLEAHEVETLRRWVEAGAPYAAHWSYVRPVRPPLPPVRSPMRPPERPRLPTGFPGWPRNAVDSFILARLEAEGLEPSPEADRHALVRRLSLDITGLPPSPEEVEELAGDDHPAAVERLVDRLLSSPAHGEHWARSWLDLARYADSAGYADDPPREIWAYRDWVIRATNADVPFDRFTLEQIAGDLLPGGGTDQVIATGFHRNTQTNNEGGTDDEEFRNVAVVDRVNTTMAVWMGTTMACAQCHDHKYDPISQEEYFRLFALFNNTQDADRGDESPTLPFFTPEEERTRLAMQARIGRLEDELRTATPELLAAQARWERDFPIGLRWASIRPSSVRSKAGAAAKVLEDGAVLVEAGQARDAYAVEAPLGLAELLALRLEALPHDSLPGKGPGHAGNGGFVVTRVRAAIAPPDAAPPAGRYVRIELPGRGRFLSLAEVQVFCGAENAAARGEASQSSTDFGGPARLAIDGNTDGDYAARSTTHTEAMDDPWWEVDLKGLVPVDRIVVWNRTDGGLQSRLDGFRARLLGSGREVLWESEAQKGPATSLVLEANGARPVPLAAAVADATQDGFDPASVLRDDGKGAGWALGAGGRQAALTLVPAQPVLVPPGSNLVLEIRQESKQERHTLGCFRLAVTDSPGAAEWARTPATVLQALATPVERRGDAGRERLTAHFLGEVAEELEPQRRELAALRKDLAAMKPHTVPVLREVPAGERRKTHVQHRGNFLDRGPEVDAGVPAAFHLLPPDAPRDRLALARWLVAPDNPLTARVTVNRHWEKVFGVGLVATSEELGAQGDLPAHPELLDWLAVDLAERGWSLKGLLRLLVTSAAYRQSSRVTPELLERDPENRLIARGPRFRLPAETIRDQALHAAGLLSRAMYGPPVRPPQPSLGVSAAFGSAIDWQPSPGEDRYRRGLYVTWRRSNPYPSMATFDASNREVCTIRRARTNTPLQALVTLNDPVYVEAAQALARRMAAEGGAAPAERARHGFRVCLAREPSEAELARIERLHREARERYAGDPEQALRMATEPLGPAPAGADLPDLAAWTVVANVLLNLDEVFLCR
ncbi:MAG: DUF1553 domain-containing protein [Planctomycetes bacterium]|nr:DUF1553 domain-containing protein [Planctomycetota bacterium]